MPRWPDAHVTDSAIFLYQTREDADAGVNIGGSGFLVGLRWDDPRASPLAFHIYAVSNYHVVKAKKPATVVRLNTHDGKSKSIETGVDEWFHRDGWDVAICRLDAAEHFRADTPYEYRFPVFTEVNLETETARKYNLGIGDEVFSVGRFVDLHGLQRNVPLVRSGIIAATGEVRIRTGPSIPWEYEQAWIVEMRSRTGFSGSPVYVYIDQLFSRLVDTEIEVSQALFHGPWILGVQSSQFPGSDPAYDQGSGMATVVPCRALADLLLRDDRVLAERAEYEARWISAPKAVESVAPSTTADNPSHREDFNSLLTAAVKGQKSAPKTSR
jgi:hypothetical protein